MELDCQWQHIGTQTSISWDYLLWSRKESFQGLFILVPNHIIAIRQTSTIFIRYTVTQAKIWPQRIWDEVRMNQIWSPNFGTSDHTGDGFDHNITNIMSILGIAMMNMMLIMMLSMMMVWLPNNFWYEKQGWNRNELELVCHECEFRCWYIICFIFLSHPCQFWILGNENVFIQGRCVHAGKLLTKHVTLFRMLLPPSIQTRGLSWKCNTLVGERLQNGNHLWMNSLEN